jgi:lysophospholipase L1-like esterase
MVRKGHWVHGRRSARAAKDGDDFVHGRQRGVIKVPKGHGLVGGLASSQRKEAKQLSDLGGSRLTWLVATNPKKKGASSYKRFQKYRGAKTIGAFMKAGGTSKDLLEDISHGYVKVHTAVQSKDYTVVKVACLGDSNTTGSGLRKRSYPHRLQQSLNVKFLRYGRISSAVLVRGFGVSGAHAAPGKNHYGSTKKFSQALAWKGNIYVIMLGTNDAHQAQGSPSEVSQSLEALVNKLRAKCPHCAPVLVLPPGCNSERCVQNMEDTVHPGIRSLGKKLGVTGVDPEITKTNARLYLREDKIHLSQGGAQKTANKLAQTIMKMLRF